MEGGEEGLDESPELLGYATNVVATGCTSAAVSTSRKRKPKVADSVKTADVLLKLGFDVSEPAFTEGGFFEATPLWYAIGRGRNHELARFLLKRGSNPNNCLWAASFNHDLEAIRLLMRGGADVDQDGPGNAVPRRGEMEPVRRGRRTAEARRRPRTGRTRRR